MTYEEALDYFDMVMDMNRDFPDTNTYQAAKIAAHLIKEHMRHEFFTHDCKECEYDNIFPGCTYGDRNPGKYCIGQNKFTPKNH